MEEGGHPFSSQRENCCSEDCGLCTLIKETVIPFKSDVNEQKVFEDILDMEPNLTFCGNIPAEEVSQIEDKYKQTRDTVRNSSYYSNEQTTFPVIANLQKQCSGTTESSMHNRSKQLSLPQISQSSFQQPCSSYTSTSTRCQIEGSILLPIIDRKLPSPTNTANIKNIFPKLTHTQQSNPTSGFTINSTNESLTLPQIVDSNQHSCKAIQSTTYRNEDNSKEGTTFKREAIPCYLVLSDNEEIVAGDGFIKRCGSCNLVFSSKELLHVHKRDIHHLKTTWECPTCRMTLYTSSGYAKHAAKHKLKKKVSQIQVSNANSDISETRIVPNEKIVRVCPLCKKKCFNITEYTKHAIKHKIMAKQSQKKN